MSHVESIHADRGATFREVAGRRVVDHYGRPARAHRAVRNGAGIIEVAAGIVAVEGADRLEYVDNVVSNRVPNEDGTGRYALVLDPQGRIERELYVYNAGDQLLLFTPPGLAASLAADWSEKVFIQDVAIEAVTDEYAVFGVHGPSATEAVASVCSTATPERQLAFVRGRIGDAGTTVVRTDALAGEEGYEVICAAADADAVYDALANEGTAAAPFGYRTWETLTLEAGTPLFASELEGRIPNVLGLRNALDFEKGCYVGQEVVSRVENRGRPPRKLVGFELDGAAGTEDAAASTPAAGAAVFDGDASVGEVTRAATSPSLEAPVAMAVVDFDLEAEAVTIRVDGEEVPAARTDLPFVEGSEQSARLPTY